MTRVQQIRELDARAWDKGAASGIVPTLGGVAILKYGDGKGRFRRYYALNGKTVTRKALIKQARRFDAKDGLEALLAKCLHEGALDELRAKRAAVVGGA